MADSFWASILAIVKSDFSLVGAVYELVQDDDVSRVDFLPEGPTGRGGQDVGAALEAEGLDVGTVVHQRGHVLVSASMSVTTSNKIP